MKLFWQHTQMDDILKPMSTKRISKVWSNTVIGEFSMLLGIYITSFSVSTDTDGERCLIHLSKSHILVCNHINKF